MIRYKTPSPHDVLFGLRKRPSKFWPVFSAACFVVAAVGAIIALVLP